MNTSCKFQRGSAATTLIYGLLIAVLVLYFLIRLMTSGTRLAPEDASDIAVNNRIQSVGIVKVSDGVEPGSRTGEQVFQKICIQCHDTNATIQFSPKLGNNADWAPRIAKGYETLIQNAINGFNTMPARGGGTDLTDDEVARAIAFMANQSGANFTAPGEGEATDAPAADAPAADAPADATNPEATPEANAQ